MDTRRNPTPQQQTYEVAAQATISKNGFIPTKEQLPPGVQAPLIIFDRDRFTPDMATILAARSDIKTLLPWRLGEMYQRARALWTDNHSERKAYTIHTLETSSEAEARQTADDVVTALGKANLEHMPASSQRPGVFFALQTLVGDILTLDQPLSNETLNALAYRDLDRFLPRTVATTSPDAPVFVDAVLVFAYFQTLPLDRKLNLLNSYRNLLDIVDHNNLRYELPFIQQRTVVFLPEQKASFVYRRENNDGIVVNTQDTAARLNLLLANIQTVPSTWHGSPLVSVQLHGLIAELHELDKQETKKVLQELIFPQVKGSAAPATVTLRPEQPNKPQESLHTIQGVAIDLDVFGSAKPLPVRLFAYDMQAQLTERIGNREARTIFPVRGESAPFADVVYNGPGLTGRDSRAYRYFAPQFGNFQAGTSHIEEALMITDVFTALLTRNLDYYKALVDSKYSGMWTVLFYVAAQLRLETTTVTEDYVNRAIEETQHAIAETRTESRLSYMTLDAYRALIAFNNLPFEQQITLLNAVTDALNGVNFSNLSHAIQTMTTTEPVFIVIPPVLPSFIQDQTTTAGRSAQFSSEPRPGIDYDTQRLQWVYQSAQNPTAILPQLFSLEPNSPLVSFAEGLRNAQSLESVPMAPSHEDEPDQAMELPIIPPDEQSEFQATVDSANRALAEGRAPRNGDIDRLLSEVIEYHALNEQASNDAEHAIYVTAIEERLAALQTALADLSSETSSGKGFIQDLWNGNINIPSGKQIVQGLRDLWDGKVEVPVRKKK